MEAVPRMPMLAFELKICSEAVEFTPTLKSYIADFYHENPENYIKECADIDQLRQVATRASRDFMGCSTLKKYYCQLQFLQSRFPMGEGAVAAISFTWEDVYSQRPVTWADIRFEQASVLYNIGSLHSILGALDNRQTPEAQAQECILEKSMTDNRKSSITAKVAAQIVDYYQLAMKNLQSSNPSSAVGSRKWKEWKKRMELKIAFHQCIQYMYQSQQSEDQQKWGERLAFMQASLDKLNSCIKMMKDRDEDSGDIEEALKFTMDVVGGKFNAAKKDNDFVYHDKVPDIESLPEIKGAALVKGIPFNADDKEVSGPDIFQKLVPMEAHEVSSLYSEEKAKLLRSIGQTVEDKNNELTQYMSSLHLDPDSVTPAPERLPQALLEKCAAISVKPDAIKDLIASMTALSSVATDVEFNIHEIMDSLENEDKQEAEYQKTFGPRRKIVGLEEIEKECKKYEEGLTKASLSNQELHKAMNTHINNLRLLSGPLDQLQQALPSVELERSPEDEAMAKEVKRLLEKVDEMKKQRESLLEQLRKHVHEDDITTDIVTRDDGNHEQFFKNQLAKHDKLLNLINQNLAAQDNILHALTETNANFATVRKTNTETNTKRDQMIRGLIQSYDVYEDLLAKSQKGVEFYRKLETNAARLLTRTRGVCKVHDEERQAAWARIKPKVEPPSRPVAPKPGQNGGSGGNLSQFPSQLPDIGLPTYPPNSPNMGVPPIGMSTPSPVNPASLPQMTSSDAPRLTLKDYLPFMKPKSFGGKKNTDLPNAGMDAAAAIGALGDYSGGMEQMYGLPGQAGSLPSSHSASPVHFPPHASSQPGSPLHLPTLSAPGTVSSSQQPSTAQTSCPVASTVQLPPVSNPTLYSGYAGYGAYPPDMVTSPTAAPGAPSARRQFPTLTDTQSDNRIGLNVIPPGGPSPHKQGNTPLQPGANGGYHNYPSPQASPAAQPKAPGGQQPQIPTSQTHAIVYPQPPPGLQNRGQGYPQSATGVAQYPSPAPSPHMHHPPPSPSPQLPHPSPTPSPQQSLPSSVPQKSTEAGSQPAQNSQFVAGYGYGQGMLSAGQQTQYSQGMAQGQPASLVANQSTAASSYRGASVPGTSIGSVAQYQAQYSQTQLPQPQALPFQYGSSGTQGGSSAAAFTTLTTAKPQAVQGYPQNPSYPFPGTQAPTGQISQDYLYQPQAPPASLGYTPAVYPSMNTAVGSPHMAPGNPPVGRSLAQQPAGLAPQGQQQIPTKPSGQQVGTQSPSQQQHYMTIQAAGQQQQGYAQAAGHQHQMNGQGPGQQQQMNSQAPGQIVGPQVPGQQQSGPQVPGQQQAGPQVPGQQQSGPQVPGQHQAGPQQTQVYNQVPGQQQFSARFPGQQYMGAQVPRQKQPPGTLTSGEQHNLAPAPGKQQFANQPQPQYSSQTGSQQQVGAPMAGQPFGGVAPGVRPGYQGISAPRQGVPGPTGVEPGLRQGIPSQQYPQGAFPVQGYPPGTVPAQSQYTNQQYQQGNQSNNNYGRPAGNQNAPVSAYSSYDGSGSISVSSAIPSAGGQVAYQQPGQFTANQTQLYKSSMLTNNQQSGQVQTGGQYVQGQGHPQSQAGLPGQGGYRYPNPSQPQAASQGGQATAQTIQKSTGVSAGQGYPYGTQTQLSANSQYAQATGQYPQYPQQTTSQAAVYGNNQGPSQPAQSYQAPYTQSTAHPGNNLTNQQAYQSQQGGHQQPGYNQPPSELPVQTNASSGFLSPTGAPDPNLPSPLQPTPALSEQPGPGPVPTQASTPQSVPPPGQEHQRSNSLPPTIPPAPQEKGPRQDSGLSAATSLDDILSSSPDAGKGAESALPGVLKPKVITADDIRRQKEEELKNSLKNCKDPYADQGMLEKFTVEVENFAKIVDGLCKQTLSGPTPLDREWRELNDEQEKIARQNSMAIARCYPLKNRYQDIMPYDNSRVILTEGKDDYINASHIGDMSPGSPKFITAQSPLPATFEDFWQMIYEQGVEVIVMLCQENEPGKQKNHTYWPTEKGQILNHGPFQLSLQSVRPKLGWVERIITFSHRTTRNSRSVVHLQFTEWSPHVVPESPAQLLQFAGEVHSFYMQQRSLMKPVVVHCSNGVGRSGAFCVVYTGMDEINQGKGLVSLAQLVTAVRQKRKYLVQDKDQLKFCYHAILYYAQDILMKRGILTNRASFGDKLPQPGERSHQRTPSEDFIMSSTSSLSAIQSSVAKMSIKPRPVEPSEDSNNVNGEENGVPDTYANLAENSQPSVLDNACDVQQTSGPNTESLTGGIGGAATNQSRTDTGQLESPANRSRSGSSCSEVSLQSGQSFGSTTASPQHRPVPLSKGNLPTSLADIQNPNTFTLDITPPTKKKITKASFTNMTSGLAEAPKDPSDPLSMLDPLWTIKSDKPQTGNAEI